MNIVWIGCHEEGLPAFKAVLEGGAKVKAFITLSEASFAKRSAGSREYESYCSAYDVNYYTVDTIKGDEAYRIIYDSRPELLVVFGWSEILPERLLDIPSIGTVGTHASLLPHNRGSAPVNWALIRGEKSTGNTLMWLSKAVDAGEIIDQVEFPITIYDTCKTLYEKVADSNKVMLCRLLEKLNKGVRPAILIENATDEPVLPRRRPKDGLINWEQPGQQVYDFIRALTFPYPGAFTFLEGEKWLIWEAALLPVSAGADDTKPGEIIGNVYGFADAINGILVGTQSFTLLITRMEGEDGVQYCGKEINELGLRGIFKNE